MAPPNNVAIGGEYFAEKQIIQILRRYITDPGIDDPLSPDRHSDTRSASYAFAATATAGQTTFPITPPIANAPIDAIFGVSVNGVSKIYGWDYLITWGDKKSPLTADLITDIVFNAGLTLNDAVTASVLYGKNVKTKDGKYEALGSFINSGFSRGAMPVPRVQVQMDHDQLEPVGIGDDFDTANNLGAIWHNVTWNVTVISQYADEVKSLSHDIMRALLVAQHDNNFLMPEMAPTAIVSMDYDIEQKLYIRVVSVVSKNREIFGAP